MLGARAITAVRWVIILVCKVMTQIARRLETKKITNKLVSHCDSNGRPPMGQLGRLGISINNTVFHTSVAGKLPEETLAGIRVFIVGGSHNVGVHRDRPRAACYNSGMGPLPAPT
jgi:hypothetical protein